MIKIRDDILNALDRGEVTIAVITDFSKAFDTVDYFSLMRKLHSLNISTSVLNLFASYLTDRTQYVKVNEKFPSHKTVNFGVPQGSILGPILFNIYVSDMKEICDDCMCVQYADDSNIYKHCKTTSIEQNIKLEKTLNEVYKWSKSKNSIFNSDKTKFMIFTTNKSKIRNADF